MLGVDLIQDGKEDTEKDSRQVEVKTDKVYTVQSAKLRNPVHEKSTIRNLSEFWHLNV